MVVLRFTAPLLVMMGVVAAGCGTPAVAPTAPQEGTTAPGGTASESVGAVEPGPPPTEDAAHGGEPAQPGPTEPAPAPTQSAGTGPDQLMAGGYAPQDVASPKVQKAAAKAVELLRKRVNDPSLALARVISAESQIVAGQNYRMEIELTSNGGTRRVKVVLFRDLQDNEQLTSVEGL